MLELVEKIKVHDGIVWDVSVHQTLPILSTCSSDKTGKIFKIGEDGRLTLLTTLDDDTHSKSVRSIRFKPGGNEYPTIALGSFDSTVSIWGADSLSKDWELLAVIEGHENEIKCIDWSSNGKYLATCARDKTIWIWETDELNEEFECICVLNEHEGDIKHIKFEPNGNGLVSCGYDDTIRIWRQDGYNEDEWNCVAILKADCTVWTCYWDNERVIRVGLDDGRIMKYQRVDANDEKVSDNMPSSITNVEDWELIEEKQVHEGAVYSIDEEYSCGRDGQIDGGKVLTNLRELNGVCKYKEYVYFADDGGFVSVYKNV